MNRLLVLLLTFFVALSLSMPTFAQETAPAGQEATEKAEKKEVKKKEVKKEEVKKKAEKKKEEVKEEEKKEEPPK